MTAINTISVKWTRVYNRKTLLHSSMCRYFVLSFTHSVSFIIRNEIVFALVCIIFALFAHLSHVVLKYQFASSSKVIVATQVVSFEKIKFHIYRTVLSQLAIDCDWIWQSLWQICSWSRSLLKSLSLTRLKTAFSSKFSTTQTLEHYIDHYDEEAIEQSSDTMKIFKAIASKLEFSIRKRNENIHSQLAILILFRALCHQVNLISTTSNARDVRYQR